MKDLSLEEKKNVDSWYNALPNRLKENVPNWIKHPEED